MDLKLRQGGSGSNTLWADGMGPERRDYFFGLPKLNLADTVHLA